MSDKAIIEWNGGEIVAIHKVLLPSPGESGFYRSVTSFEGFHNRELNRNFPTKKDESGRDYVLARVPKGRSFSCNWWEDFERNLTDDLKPLIVAHASIWDFYMAVGYDYKRRRYVEAAPAGVAADIDSLTP